jgi:tetratricopeptide (TPR) repeat protein
LEYWIQGNAKTALAELQRAEKNGVPGNKKLKEGFASKVGGFYLALGQPRAAAEHYARLEDPQVAARSAYELGNYPLAKEYLRTMKDPNPVSVVLMARLGLVREAERALPKLKENRLWTERTIRIVRAELALARNQNQKALALLQEGLDGGRANPLTLQLGLQALATAWERQGDLTKAAEALEKASELRLRLVPPSGDVWLRNRWRQAQLYRKMGRVAEARQIEAELRKLLAVADEDYPVLVQLKQIQEEDAHAAQLQRRAR